MDRPEDVFRRIVAMLGEAPDAPDAGAEAARIMDAAAASGEFRASVALELAAQRARGILLPQLLGRTTFMNLDLDFEPGVFVVREETELLGWTSAGKLEGLDSPRIADLGCGAGNLTCGMAKALPGARIWSIDIDPSCIALTLKNVKRHALSERVTVMLGDLFAPLAGMEGTLDAVVCNPPYIASVRLEKDRAYLVENEPRAAFDGGPFGISIQMRLAREAKAFLKPGGWLLFEFGVGQERQVKQLVDRAGGYDVVDFACNPKGEARVSVNRKGL